MPIYKLINDKNIFRIENDSPVYNLILLNKNYLNINNLNLNVLGIDQNLLDKINANKKKDISEMNLQFSKSTQVKLNINNFRN